MAFSYYLRHRLTDFGCKEIKNYEVNFTIELTIEN